MSIRGVSATLMLALGLSAPAAPVNAAAPYPQSSVISGITWDVAGLQRAAPGSDLWPSTWADDDNLYTVWGDGGGFGGDNTLGRVSLGVARVSGTGDSWQGTNVYGGYNAPVPSTIDGKPGGIISIGGTLYMSVTEQNTWIRAKVFKSTDHGLSWTSNPGWDFDNIEGTGVFSTLVFLNFGKDYQGARDNYVYVYSQKDGLTVHKNILLARVPKDQLMTPSAYEFFAGRDGSGNPTWSANIAQRQPTFTDPDQAGGQVCVTYDPGIRRYLLTVWHDQSGGWGMYDAPEPWGPWTTVAYYSNWLDADFKFSLYLNQKWMSAGGTTFWMTFSGDSQWDSFNVIKGTFTLSSTSPDNIAPIRTTDLRAAQ